MNEYNDKGERHGPWVFYLNGKLGYKTNYVNGKRHGLCEDYYYNGNLSFKGNYINGKMHGLIERHTSNNKLYIKQYYI